MKKLNNFQECHEFFKKIKDKPNTIAKYVANEYKALCWVNVCLDFQTILDFINNDESRLKSKDDYNELFPVLLFDNRAEAQEYLIS
jgi:hypothetical protein